MHVLCVFAVSLFVLVAIVRAVDDSTTSHTSASDSDEGARILVSKFFLSQYAVEEKDYVVDYRLYNNGDKPALKVSLDDRHSFPTQTFEIVRGLLQVLQIYEYTLLISICCRFDGNELHRVQMCRIRLCYDRVSSAR